MSQDDHYHVGYQDAMQGNSRYEFQDQHLQAQYDKGYNDAVAGKRNAFSIYQQQSSSDLYNQLQNMGLRKKRP